MEKGRGRGRGGEGKCRCLFGGRCVSKGALEEVGVVGVVVGVAVGVVVEKDQSLTWRPRRLHYWQPHLCSLHRPSFR